MPRMQRNRWKLTSPPDPLKSLIELLAQQTIEEFLTEQQCNEEHEDEQPPAA
jgi:hypothetical protein